MTTLTIDAQKNAIKASIVAIPEPQLSGPKKIAAIQAIRELDDFAVPIAYGLIVKDTDFLQFVKGSLLKEGIYVFYSILFYSILFYSILFAFYSILFAFYSILFYSILFYSILFYSIRLLFAFYSILFYSPLFALFYSINSFSVGNNMLHGMYNIQIYINWFDKIQGGNQVLIKFCTVLHLIGILIRSQCERSSLDI